MLHLNEDTVSELSSGIVLVDVYTNWCAPCRKFAPVFESMSHKMKDVKFAKVNHEEFPGFAETYGVSALPTIFVFKDGKVVHKWLGIVSQREIEEVVGKHK